MKRKEPTPNYDLMFQNAVSQLKLTVEEYKKSAKKEFDNLFVTSDGHWGVLAGYEKQQQKTQKLGEEVTRLKEEVDKLRILKGGK